MSSNDDKTQELTGAEARHKANALMEQALILLDLAEEDLVAAKLDDAICVLGVRQNNESS